MGMTDSAVFQESKKTNELLKQLLAEARRTNELLERLAVSAETPAQRVERLDRDGWGSR